jgi:hypothetical protein
MFSFVTKIEVLSKHLFPKPKAWIMKIIIPILLCFFMACNAQRSLSKLDSKAMEMKDQVATVETHVISRGSYQYVLVVSDGPNAGKYLPEEDLPPQYCQHNLKVKIDGKILDKKAVVYKPGPTDKPEKDFEIPMIRLTEVHKRED